MLMRTQEGQKHILINTDLIVSVTEHCPGNVTVTSCAWKCYIHMLSGPVLTCDGRLIDFEYNYNLARRTKANG